MFFLIPLLPVAQSSHDDKGESMPSPQGEQQRESRVSPRDGAGGCTRISSGFTGYGVRTYVLMVLLGRLRSFAAPASKMFDITIIEPEN